MKAVEEITAEVYAELYVNGRKMEADELVKALQRLLNACEQFLPPHHLYDDTPQHVALRRAVEAVHELEAFA